MDKRRKEETLWKTEKNVGEKWMLMLVCVCVCVCLREREKCSILLECAHLCALLWVCARQFSPLYFTTNATTKQLFYFFFQPIFKKCIFCKKNRYYQTDTLAENIIIVVVVVIRRRILHFVSCCVCFLVLRLHCFAEYKWYCEM